MTRSDLIRTSLEAPGQRTRAVTVLAAVGVALAAGVYPAMRASRLTTIDAIQRE